MKANSNHPRNPGTALEVFWAFLRLGCSAFGGPLAHFGYFQVEFVKRRQWMTEEAYADLVALCQLLPGPASSQTGLGIGYRRAGWRGALAAWLGFTLPSAFLMTAFALGLGAVGNLAHAGWVQGLKVVAVAVVAQALLAMARTHCPDWSRAAIASVCALLLVIFGNPFVQFATVVGGALAFYLWGNHGGGRDAPRRAPRRAGLGWGATACLVGYLSLLLLASCVTRAWPTPRIQLAAALYHAGALVFGGGHVVLPLLEQATVARGWLSQDTFLAGYGAAQALPGPLFAFASYLGAIIPPGGAAGALIGLGAIYLPAVLILFAALPHWERLRESPSARRLLAGANAAVVGLLAAAFYSPIWTTSVTSLGRLALAVAAFVAIEFWRASPWLVVLLSAVVGAMTL